MQSESEQMSGKFKCKACLVSFMSKAQYSKHCKSKEHKARHKEFLEQK